VNHQTDNNLADRHLVEKVLRGDTRAFGIIITRTEALVARLIFKMIPNTEDRKDIVQDIYLKVFNKLDGFKFQAKLSTWIAQIAYNTCLTWLEKKRLILPGNPYPAGEDQEAALEQLYHKSAGDAGVPSSDGRMIQKQQTEIIQEEINRLPPVYHTLISLYHQEEMSYEELVLITGLPEGTVKSYLFRARKMLKEKLLLKYKKEAL